MVSLTNEEIHALATNYVGIASYSVLVYDYLLTFSDEVELIWRKKKSLATHLFFLNRYFFLFSFIPNLIAYLSPWFGSKLCFHFVRYEGAQAVIGIGIAGLMMGLRVNALYAGYRPIKVILVALWLFQVVVFCVFLTGGTPVPRSISGIGGGCSMIFGPDQFRMGTAALTAAAPVLFDSVVVVLTAHKCMGALRRSGGLADSPSTLLSKHLLEDGLVYYIVVFTANLALAIMIVYAPPGLKNILSQFSQLITATMLSRITIHLRAIGERRRSSLVISSSPHSNINGQWRAQTIMGVLNTGEMDMVTYTQNSQLKANTRDSSGLFPSQSATISGAVSNLQNNAKDTDSNPAPPGSRRSSGPEQRESQGTRTNDDWKGLDRSWSNSELTLNNSDNAGQETVSTAAHSLSWDEASAIEAGEIFETESHPEELQEALQLAQDGGDNSASLPATSSDFPEERHSNVFACALDVLQSPSPMTPSHRHIEVSVEIQIDTVHR